jgi:hypothetical protein
MKQPIQTVVGVITHAEAVSSGSGERGSWTKYKVTINETSYTTFDAYYIKHVGESGEFPFVEERYTDKSGTIRNGKRLLSLKVKPPEPQPASQPAAISPEFIEKAESQILVEIAQNVRKILDIIETQNNPLL